MATIERSIEIEAPIEEVFGFASDWQNWATFFEGVSDFKPLTEIERGNGAKYAYKARMLGISAPVETEIRDFAENHGWTGICRKGLEHETNWTFLSVSGKTRFTYGLQYRIPVPIVGNLLDTLIIKPQWERIIERSLANLKALMEREE